MLDCKPVAVLFIPFIIMVLVSTLPSGIFLMKFGYSFNAFPENIQ